MNSQEKLKLQEMINTYGVSDQTDLMRELKHSKFIYDDVNAILNLRIKMRGKSENELMEACQTRCYFLYKNYTDIFNKVVKNEINLDILLKFLNVLQEIENGNVDQHEASFVIGKLLKEMYIDSAMKKAGKMDPTGNITDPSIANIPSSDNKSKEKKNISWNEWKNKA